MSTLATLYLRPSTSIELAHISHIIGEANYSHVHFVDGSRTLFSRTLKTFEVEHAYLIRASKQLLVNPDSITAWQSSGVNTIQIDVAGVQYSVSRRRAKAVMEQLIEALMSK